MKKKMTRTQADPRYAQVNGLAAKRSNFLRSLCVEYMRKFHPDVVQKIREKAREKYPVPEKLARSLDRKRSVLDEIISSGFEK